MPEKEKWQILRIIIKYTYKRLDFLDMEVPKNKVQIIKSMNICDVFPVATFIFKTRLLSSTDQNYNNILGTVNVRLALAFNQKHGHVQCCLQALYHFKKSYCGIINLFLKLTQKKWDRRNRPVK